MASSRVVTTGCIRPLATLALFVACVSGVVSTGCSSRRARWNYAPVDEAAAPSAGTQAERVRFDPDAMERLIVDQGCTACHTFHGERLVGPPLDRLGGAPRRFTDGTTGVVDEAYLVESILEPDRKVVEGFQAVMPSYAERIDEAEAEALAAYLVELH